MEHNIDERETILHQLIFGNTEGVEKIQLGGSKIKTKPPINNENMNFFDFINTQKGGDNPDMLIESAYFQKINTLFVILFISILLTILIMKPLVGTIFREGEPDSNFEDPNVEPSKRWKKIIKFTFIFILFIIGMHFVIFLILLIVFYLKIVLSDEKTDLSEFALAKKKLKEMIWEYKDQNDKSVSLTSYYFLLFFVLIVMFIFYMIYTKLVKGYFNNMFYESVYNPNNPDIEDIPQPLKYLYQYSAFIILMMLFVLLLLNYSKLSGLKILFIYNIFFVVMYALITLSILRYRLQNDMGKFIVFLILFVLLFIGYKIILLMIFKLINPQAVTTFKLSKIEKYISIILLIIFIIAYLFVGSQKPKDQEDFSEQK